jgi:L-threonylcarbamoyladenylate synthase
MDFENDILNCLQVLKAGGLILYPTDTIWGIGCDATNSSAVKKIYELKNRPDKKSMIVLVSSEKEILKYVSQLDLQVFDFLKVTQKPTTVIYDGCIGLADDLVGEDGSVAIRISGDEFCKHLIRRFRKPIVSTSANISGASFPRKFSDISNQIKSGVDYVVHYRQHDDTISQPSTLIKWQKGKVITLRP